MSKGFGPIYKSPVAGSVPFDNTASSFQSTEVQSALKEVRQRIALDQSEITTSAAGTTTLTATSNSLQVFIGTAVGHSLVLPNATTLTKGHHYEIWNLSSQSVLIKNAGGTTLATLKANGQTFVLLRDNGTSNGNWALTYTLDNGNVFGTQIYDVVDESETSNNSGTTWANKLTLTTPASLPLGDYLLNFQFIWRSSNANREADFRFQLNGSDIVAWSPSTARTQDRQLLSGFKRTPGISGVNTYTFDFKWTGSSTTIFVQQARMFIWRIA
jgi:hypothetical protein